MQVFLQTSVFVLLVYHVVVVRPVAASVTPHSSHKYAVLYTQIACLISMPSYLDSFFTHSLFRLYDFLRHLLLKYPIRLLNLVLRLT